MELLKSRNFGDYFNDTFQFFKINFKSIVANFFKIQGILLILILISGYFFNMRFTEDIMGNASAFGATPPQNPNEILSELSSLFGMYLNLEFFIFIIATSISSIITINFIPIYMELYREKKDDITFTDIIDKYKEHASVIVLLTLSLVLLAIPIYLVTAIAFFISLITIVGWVFVLGFILSYMSQIWFHTNYYKSGPFQALGNVFSIYKDHFFKITGATILFSLMFFIILYIILMVVIFALAATISIENLLIGPNGLSDSSTLMFMAISQLFNIIIGSIMTLLLQTQQGIIFYSRVNDLDQISEHQDINSIGEASVNQFIQD